MADKKTDVEMVRLHNQGKRTHNLRNGVKSAPGRAIKVPVKDAEFYVKEYPFDFILYEDLAAASEVREDNKKLSDDKAKLEARIAELEADAAKTKVEKPKPKAKNNGAK